MRHSLAILLCVALSSCAMTEAVLDYPMSFFDEETGETIEVPLGDVIADQGDGVAGIVGDALGGVNPLLGLLGAGGAAALLGKARRKKKPVTVAAETPPAGHTDEEKA